MRTAVLLALSLAAPAFASDKPAAAPAVHIQPNAKVYIAPMNGFESDLAAAIIKKHVPLTVVDDPKSAQYTISGTNETVKAGWAKTLFVTPLPADHASITVKTSDGVVVYAYEWDKMGARKGAQSAAEGIAKHLKKNIDGK